MMYYSVMTHAGILGKRNSEFSQQEFGRSTTELQETRGSSTSFPGLFPFMFKGKALGTRLVGTEAIKLGS